MGFSFSNLISAGVDLATGNVSGALQEATHIISSDPNNLRGGPVAGGPTIGEARAAFDNVKSSSPDTWAAFVQVFTSAVGHDPHTRAGDISNTIVDAMTHGDNLKAYFLDLVAAYGTYCSGHGYCADTGLPATPTGQQLTLVGKPLTQTNSPDIGGALDNAAKSALTAGAQSLSNSIQNSQVAQQAKAQVFTNAVMSYAPLILMGVAAYFAIRALRHK